VTCDIVFLVRNTNTKEIKIMNTFECRNCSFTLTFDQYDDTSEVVFCPRCGKMELFQQVPEEVDENLENFGREDHYRPVFSPKLQKWDVEEV
jgi:DNA-directed RNA polymerase subunit RPC12/RpoP